MEFVQAIERILEHEGGFVDDPLDRGGATNLGITQGTLSAYRRSHASRDDVRNLRREEAIQIYRSMYWDANQVQKLPASLRGVYFDVCVNAGGGRACSLLQRAINSLGGNVAEDGGIGPITIAAANRPGIEDAFTDQRIAFYKRIVQNDPSQIRFLQGWLNRAEAWR